MILELIYVQSADEQCIKKKLAEKDFGYRITHGSLLDSAKEGNEKKDFVGTKACELVHYWAIDELTQILTDDQYMDIWGEIKKVINNQDNIQVEWRNLKKYNNDAESKFIIYHYGHGNPIGKGSCSINIYAIEKVLNKS